MKIYLDFDGTVVEHAYPKMGRCNFGSIEIIKKLQDAGHEIILNTYRADCNNGTLEEALKLLNENYWMVLKKSTEDMLGFEMLPITEYCTEKLHPEPFDWDRIKDTGIMFIDDMAINTPLKKAVMCNNMMVDWDELDRQFVENGVY